MAWLFQLESPLRHWGSQGRWCPQQHRPSPRTQRASSGFMLQVEVEVWEGNCRIRPCRPLPSLCTWESRGSPSQPGNLALSPGSPSPGPTVLQHRHRAHSSSSRQAHPGPRASPSPAPAPVHSGVSMAALARDGHGTSFPFSEFPMWPAHL